MCKVTCRGIPGRVYECCNDDGKEKSSDLSRVSDVLQEWESKSRRMGCVAAAQWFSKRVPGFKPKRLTRYTADGREFQHVVATDGKVVVDLAPYADRPREDEEYYLNKYLTKNPGHSDQLEHGKECPQPTAETQRVLEACDDVDNVVNALSVAAADENKEPWMRENLIFARYMDVQQAIAELTQAVVVYNEPDDGGEPN